MKNFYSLIKKKNYYTTTSSSHSKSTNKKRKFQYDSTRNKFATLQQENSLTKEMHQLC